MGFDQKVVEQRITEWNSVIRSCGKSNEREEFQKRLDEYQRTGVDPLDKNIL